MPFFDTVRVDMGCFAVCSFLFAFLFLVYIVPPLMGLLFGIPFWFLGFYFINEWYKLGKTVENHQIPLPIITRPRKFVDKSYTLKKSTSGLKSPIRSQTDYKQPHFDENIDHYQPERTNEHKYPTDKGDWVRSQGEAVIADTLWKLGIKYDYERPLRHPIIYEMKIPDFTIYYRGTIYYWEHLGMIDDEEYHRRWESTRRWYESAGFGNQLITSQPDSFGQVNQRDIENIVKLRIMDY